MANEHPLTDATATHLRNYIKLVSRLPQEAMEEELAAQIKRLQARDRNLSPIAR